MTSAKEDTMWISLIAYAVVESYILYTGITTWKKAHKS